MSKCPDCNSIKMLAATMGLHATLPETTMCWGCQPEISDLHVPQAIYGFGDETTRAEWTPNYYYVHMSEPAYWEESYCKCSCHKQAARSCSACVPCTGGPVSG